MQAVFGAFRVLLWFIYQAVNVGGLGWAYFAVPFLAIGVFLIINFRKQDSLTRKELRIPLLIFAGLWGGFFWLDWAHHAPANPTWVGYVPEIAAAIFILLTCFYVWELGNARLFVAGYAFVNFYFMFVMWALSGMAISGTWL